MDIEQMTWRQFCLLEGFKRRGDRSNFEISHRAHADVNGLSIELEIKKLMDLRYLYSDDNPFYWKPMSFEAIYISDLGREFSGLLGLHSVEDDEIGPAFGKGKVTITKTKTY